MKCLITGINGFAGTHLAEYLLGENAVIAGTVYPRNAGLDITSAKNEIRLFPCDLASDKQITGIIKETQPEYIFHLAAQSFVPKSWQQPEETFNINVQGTLHLLQSVKEYAPKATVLFIGSGEEYGPPSSDKPLTEDHPLAPQNPYATSKACAGLLSAQLGRYYNIKIIRTRSFPHLGPGQSPDFVASDFCRQVALIEQGKQPPEMKVGNLNSRRDFTDVRDIVRAYWLAATRGIPGEVYNIASGKALSIKEILDKILALGDKQIKVVTDSAKFRPQDPPAICGSSQKLYKLTGWQPEIPIDQTLQEILNWWRDRV